MANVQQQVQASKGPDVQKGKKDNQDFSIQIWSPLRWSRPGWSRRCTRSCASPPLAELSSAPPSLLSTSNTDTKSEKCICRMFSTATHLLRFHMCQSPILLKTLAPRQFCQSTAKTFKGNFVSQFSFLTHLDSQNNSHFLGAAELPLLNGSNSPNPKKR